MSLSNIFTVETPFTLTHGDAEVTLEKGNFVQFLYAHASVTFLISTDRGIRFPLSGDALKMTLDRCISTPR